MSEIKTLEMPKWGLSMEEGLLARWAIQEGDDFTRGQEICEIETSKIVNVLEAPFAGTLRRIIAREGETLQVGAVLALVADASVSDAELDEFAASLATVKPAAPDPEAATPDVPAQAGAKPPSVVSPPSNSPEPPIGQTVIPVSLQGVTDVTQVNATPHALRLSARWGVDLKKSAAAGAGIVSLFLIWKARSLPPAVVWPLRRPPFVAVKRPARMPMIARYRPPRWRAVWPANWVSTYMTAEAAVHAVG